jgi:hypothetical protein
MMTIEYIMQVPGGNMQLHPTILQATLTQPAASVSLKISMKSFCLIKQAPLYDTRMKWRSLFSLT